MERIDVLVVGGGSAGLAVSHELARLGVDHVVLERDRIGESWRRRWDSFCLVTPNWTIRLPGAPVVTDPDGYLHRDDIVAMLEGYARGSGAPVREGVDVRTIQHEVGDFVARTSDGDLRARRVVVASGTFRRAHRPAGADTLPPDVLAIDMEAYRREADLPPGRVLIVGSGQSGCQLAEELREAGREVVLSCGRAVWAPRRIDGRDLLWWLEAAGYMEHTLADLPSPMARLGANPLATGHGGGHDLHLRTLRAQGVTLAGRFLGAEGRTVRFAPDLDATVAWGDERYREMMQDFAVAADERGLPRPAVEDPEPITGAAPERLPLDGVGAVVFAGGYRPAYRSWLPWADAFDDMGFPLQVDGRSSVVDGLYFVGTHFLRTRKSSILMGVGEDASVVAASIAS